MSIQYNPLKNIVHTVPTFGAQALPRANENIEFPPNSISIGSKEKQIVTGDEFKFKGRVQNLQLFPMVSYNKEEMPSYWKMVSLLGITNSVPNSVMLLNSPNLLNNNMGQSVTRQNSRGIVNTLLSSVLFGTLIFAVIRWNKGRLAAEAVEKAKEKGAELIKKVIDFPQKIGEIYLDPYYWFKKARYHFHFKEPKIEPKVIPPEPKPSYSGYYYGSGGSSGPSTPTPHTPRIPRTPPPPPPGSTLGGFWDEVRLTAGGFFREAGSTAVGFGKAAKAFVTFKWNRMLS